MKFKSDQPFVETGLGVKQVSFSGGRVAVNVAEHGGITSINYYGNQRLGDVYLYKSDSVSSWAQLYRPSVEIDGKHYHLNINDTSIYPFGYSSSAMVGDGVKIEHGMYLLNDAIVFSFEVVENPPDSDVVFKLINAATCTQINKATRTWAGITKEDNTFISSISDYYPEDLIGKEKEEGHTTLAQEGTAYCSQVSESKIWFGLVSGTDIEMRETPDRFTKHYFSTKCVDGKAVFALAFNHDGKTELKERLDYLSSNADLEVSKLKDNYYKQISSPSITADNKTVQSLISNTGAFLDSIKVKDVPGGIRAADSGYWIWGWDSIIYSEAFAYCNDFDYIVEMLEFYKSTADSEYGIFHEMTVDQRPFKSMAFSAQCLYVVMLYKAYLFSGDNELLEKYLPFCRWIIEKATDTEVDNSGLLKGVALYPDHPEDLEQDGNDLSSFNNSIYYQALRSIAELSEISNDMKSYNEYMQMAEKTRKAFDMFFDPEVGFYYDSLSSLDFSPRKHYPCYAVLWVTPFAKDLVAERIDEIAQFMRKHLSLKVGNNILPRWDTHFMLDGCQLGMYMPVVEKFYREVMYWAKDSDEINKFLNDMSYFWEQISIPEALSSEYENLPPTIDNPGRKQAFCAKSWLCSFYNIIVGLQVGPEGLKFTTSDAGDISVSDLTVRNSKIDVKVSGKGWNIDSLTFNGEAVAEPFVIPFSSLKEENSIIISRKS